VLYLIAGLAVLGALIFFPRLRRILGVVLSIAITLLATSAAIFGIAVLMNNVSINERPGMSARINRFLSKNWATTSEKGLGYLTCEDTEKTAGQTVEAGAPEKSKTNSRPAKGKGPAAAAAPLAAAPSPTPTPMPDAAEDVYPELVQRGYPGIPREKLFKLSEQTINELPGWKIVKSDEKTGTLETIYATRLLHFNDDVKIQVTPRSEIHLCSKSRVGKGDFGANVGHVKEFYTALEPKVDEAYKEEERKQNAQPPAARPH